MIKRCTLIRRREDLSEQHFHEHWATKHAKIAVGFEGVVRYNQNHVRNVLWKSGTSDFQIDGVVELWFQSQQTVDRNATSATIKALIEDEPKFLSGLTGCLVGATPLPNESSSDAKAIILLRTEDQNAVEAEVRNALGDTTVSMTFDTLTPGFVREALWSEPEPPNMMIKLWSKDPDSLNLIADEKSLISAAIVRRSNAAKAVEIDELRIV